MGGARGCQILSLLPLHNAMGTHFAFGHKTHPRWQQQQGPPNKSKQFTKM